MSASCSAPDLRLPDSFVRFKSTIVDGVLPNPPRRPFQQLFDPDATDNRLLVPPGSLKTATVISHLDLLERLRTTGSCGCDAPCERTPLFEGEMDAGQHPHLARTFIIVDFSTDAARKRFTDEVERCKLPPEAWTLDVDAPETTGATWRVRDFGVKTLQPGHMIILVDATNPSHQLLQVCH